MTDLMFRPAAPSEKDSPVVAPEGKRSPGTPASPATSATSPVTPTSPATPADPDASEKKPWVTSSAPQLMGGALAAVVVSVAGSTMGTAGTLVGAAIGSVLSAVSSQLFTSSIERGRDGVRLVVRRRPTTDEQAAATDADEDATAVDAPTAQPSPASTPAKPRIGRRWALTLGALGTAAASFVLGMAVVTGVEASTGHSLSGQQGTTVRQVLPAPASEDAEPADEPTSDATVEPSAEPTAEPTAPQTGQPTGLPTEPAASEPAPTQPATEPSTAPTEAPAPAASAPAEPAVPAAAAHAAAAPAAPVGVAVSQP